MIVLFKTCQRYEPNTHARITFCFWLITRSPKSTNITSKSNASCKLKRSEAILLVWQIFYLYTFCAHNHIFYAPKKKKKKKKPTYFMHIPWKTGLYRFELKEKKKPTYLMLSIRMSGHLSIFAIQKWTET